MDYFISDNIALDFHEIAGMVDEDNKLNVYLAGCAHILVFNSKDWRLILDAYKAFTQAENDEEKAWKEKMNAPHDTSYRK